MKIVVYTFLASCALILVSCTEKAEKPTKDEMVLFDFEEGFDQSMVHPQDATYSMQTKEENTFILVTNGYTIKEPGVVLKSTKDAPWDLNGYQEVKADISNVGDEFIQVEMFVGNDPDGLKRWYCSDYVDLEPGESKTITVPLAWTSWIHEPQPEILGMRGVPGQLKTDISKIQEITFNSRYAYKKNNFTIDNVRAIGKFEKKDPSNVFPFIDEFGQYKHEDWVTKIHSVAELKNSIAENAKDLENHPGPDHRNKFGGWTAGPKLEATGFFRSEKVDGKWWMVDPEGYLFWSAGVNCVASESVYSGIEGREHYFEKIPAKEDVPEHFFNDGVYTSHGFYKDKATYQMFNFYQNNLYKKYDGEWHTNFKELAHQRLKSWGLNTVGFVSDNELIAQQRTPYVGSIWITDTPKIEGSQGFWGKFHDVFDPNFRLAVKNSVERQKEGAGDPWCIGYFVDNELSWGALGSLAVGTLQSPATQPAKIEFVKDLRTKYQDIAKLNAVWGTQHRSWAALLETMEAPDTKKAQVDLLAFYQKIAETYFNVINGELKKVAPNQNYLGCRFAWKNNAIVLTAASHYMDIMSFNKYEYSIENIGLPKGVDKPMLIGEFHFGAKDRGLFHAGVKAAESQEDRGIKYQAYIQGAFKNPNIVGAHWFQYLDQPLTGRFDGENYNVGLLDIADNPHKPMIDKMRETLYDMYSYRTAQ